MVNLYYFVLSSHSSSILPKRGQAETLSLSELTFNDSLHWTRTYISGWLGSLWDLKGPEKKKLFDTYLFSISFVWSSRRNLTIISIYSTLICSCPKRNNCVWSGLILLISYTCVLVSTLVTRACSPVGQECDLSISKRMTNSTTGDGVGERRQITF